MPFLPKNKEAMSGMTKNSPTGTVIVSNSKRKIPGEVLMLNKTLLVNHCPVNQAYRTTSEIVPKKNSKKTDQSDKGSFFKENQLRPYWFGEFYHG